MKFSMSYSDTFRYQHDIDEILYTPKFSDVKILQGEIKRITEDGKRRVIIELSSADYDNKNLLQSLKAVLDEREEYKQCVWFTLYFNCMLYERDNHKEYFGDYKFFYKDIIQDWEMLHVLKTCGVAAMRIGGQLGFEIDKVAENLHAANIEVRVKANETTCIRPEVDSLVQFWIRPEDIPYYEEYVDVMELIAYQEHNASIVYKAYALDQKWFGPYEEIIYGLDNDIDGRFTIPRFGEARIGCGRRCLKDQRCQSCYVIANLGTSFETKGVYVNTH